MSISSDRRARVRTVNSFGALVAPLNAVFVSRSTSKRRSPARTNSTPELARRRTRSERSLSTSNATTMSVDEYASLPSSVKKKYFSSTERLRIVQQTAAEKRRKQSHDATSYTSSSIHTDLNVRPMTSSGVSVWRRPSRSHRSHSTVAPPTIDSFRVENISEEQARWYLGLPDKIRKQQFTRNEQVSLAIRCKRALDDTAPDFANDALRRCLSGRNKTEHVQTLRRRKRQSSLTINTDILDDEFPTADIPDRRAYPESVSNETEILELYTNPDPHDASELISIPPPPSMPLEPVSTPKIPRRSSFSRALALAPISLPPPQLSPVPPVPPLPAALQQHLYSNAPQWAEVDDTEYAPSSTKLTNNVPSYHQPDVRKQLRHYLTPEKFDEALEFGFSFPADDQVPSSSATDQSFPHQPPALCHTDDGEEDSSDSLEIGEPRTPTTVAENMYPTMKQPSVDSTAEGSLRQNFYTAMKPVKSRSPVGSLGNREMTIHMTLTRRDLLDVERVDPLALEALPVCDDPTGASGAFAVSSVKSPRGFRRVWKSLLRH